MSKKLSKSEAGKLGSLASKKTQEANYSKRVEAYSANPTRCWYCSTSLPYAKRRNKFCGSSCSAQHNNRRRLLKTFLDPTFCLSCGKMVRKLNTYCSSECHHSYQWERLKAQTISDPLRATERNLKRVMLEDRGHSCEECGRSSWQGQPIPLDMDHINGDPHDHRFENLRLLCLNCHGLTPTFKAKNKGKGRKSRRTK